MGDVPLDDLLRQLMLLEAQTKASASQQIDQEEFVSVLTDTWNDMSTEDQKSAYQEALVRVDNDELDVTQSLRYQANQEHQTELFDSQFWAQTDIDQLRMLAAKGVGFQLWDHHNRTVMHAAVLGSSSEVINWLIKFTNAGQVSAGDNNGMQPIHAAAMGGTPAVVEALLAAGADPKAETTQERFTPLHCAAIASAAGPVAPAVIIGLLVEAGAELEALDVLGRTPLHAAAARTPYPLTIQALIDNGADPNARAIDGHGCAPLHYAAIHSRTPEIVQMLLDKGAEVGMGSYGNWTPCGALQTRETRDDVYFELDRMLCKQEPASESQ